MGKYRLTITVTEDLPAVPYAAPGTVLYDNPNLTERSLGRELVSLGWATWVQVETMHTPELIKHLHAEHQDGSIRITTV